MTIRRIAKIEDLGSPNWHGGFFNVWFEGATIPLACCKAQLDLLKYENEMLQIGISEEVIEKHRDLVIDHVQDEQALDGESE